MGIGGDILKKFRLCFLMVTLFSLYISSSVFAQSTVTFKPLNVYVDSDNQVVVEGKFWNYGDGNNTIDGEKMQVSYSSPNNQSFSATVEFKELNLPINSDQVIHYSFKCPTLTPVQISKWSVNVTTYSH